MKKYRIKFTISDGRQIYASKRGVPQEVGEEAKARELDFIRNGAYTEDLFLFGNPEFLRTTGKKILRIIAVEYEDAEKPVDRSAYIQGGSKVS